MSKNKPYSRDSVCPQCKEPGLHPVANDAQEVIGAKCKKCRLSANLRPFPFEGALGYFVGDDGRAYSIQKGFRALVPKLNRGFPRIRLSIDGRDYYPYLATAVLHGFGRPRPPGFDCKHKDGNVRNCALSNVEWAFIRSTQVDAVRFVSAWQKSTSVQDVADRLGLTYGAVAARATTMRRHGVNLKSMSDARGNRLDWEELAKLADAFTDDAPNGERQ